MIFGYGRGRGGIGNRGGRGGRVGCGVGRGEKRGNNNSYNKHRSQNHNHGIDTSNLPSNFTPENPHLLFKIIYGTIFVLN